MLPFTTEEIRQDDPARAPDVFDLIVNRHGAATPVEIKSAATFSTSFADGVLFFRSAFPNCRPGVVVYNGDDALPPYKDVALANPL